jgi:phage repressor protein C with HTH and peptisase S24 domain
MDKISTIKERILSFLEYKGIKKADFYQTTGVADSNFKGKNLYSQPGSDVLVKILTSYPDISAEWLLTGNGPMLKTKATPNASPTGGGYNSSPKDTNKVPNKQEKEARRSTKGIPLIPLDAVAGFPAAADNDGVYMEDCEHYSIPEFEAKGANFLIRVSGDSMMPLYNNGDIIACRKISDILFFQWGSIYVLDTSQGALVKRVEEAEDDADSILCISENPRFKPFHLPKSDIRSLSTIIGLVRLV